jgi:hypothetical protein
MNISGIILRQFTLKIYNKLIVLSTVELPHKMDRPKITNSTLVTREKIYLLYLVLFSIKQLFDFNFANHKKFISKSQTGNFNRIKSVKLYDTFEHFHEYVTSSLYLIGYL